jgi:apoptosis-inducing factor 2
MASETQTTQKARVVIVGGGAAGASVAKALSTSLPPSSSKEPQIILVNPRPFYAHLIASLRPAVTVSGNFEERLQIGYEGVTQNGAVKVVIGTVATVVPDAADAKKGGHVVLENGDTIGYEVLVLATGSTWQGPASLPDTKEGIHEHLEAWRQKIESAKSVLVVGGGAVGIGVHFLYFGCPRSNMYIFQQNLPQKSRTSHLYVFSSLNPET